MLVRLQPATDTNPGTLYLADVWQPVGACWRQQVSERRGRLGSLSRSLLHVGLCAAASVMRHRRDGEMTQRLRCVDVEHLWARGAVGGWLVSRQNQDVEEERIEVAPRGTYRLVAEHVRQQIVGGSLRPGALVPSEIALAEHHGVARGTVRSALAMLVDEG